LERAESMTPKYLRLASHSSFIGKDEEEMGHFNRPRKGIVAQSFL
jgi:hypothetical protein